MRNKVASCRAVKVGAIAGGCVLASPVYLAGVVVTLGVKSGGIKTRAANAVIWPFLVMPVHIDDDHTIGGFKSKWLLAANRRFDKALR